MFVRTTKEIENKLEGRNADIYEKQKKRYDNLCEMLKINMGSCYSLNHAGEWQEESNVWKSFDENTGNFHIVPAERDKENVTVLKQQLVKELVTTQEGKFKEAKVGRATMPWTKNHMWLECVNDDYHYLILFQTLIFENDKLNCYLDRIQFCKYPADAPGPNMLTNGVFKCEYPGMNKEGEGEGKSESTFENTNIVIGKENSIEKCVKDIIESFKAFVGE